MFRKVISACSKAIFNTTNFFGQGNRAQILTKDDFVKGREAFENWRKEAAQPTTDKNWCDFKDTNFTSRLSWYRLTVRLLGCLMIYSVLFFGGVLGAFLQQPDHWLPILNSVAVVYITSLFYLSYLKKYIELSSQQCITFPDFLKRISLNPALLWCGQTI